MADRCTACGYCEGSDSECRYWDKPKEEKNGAVKKVPAVQKRRVR